MLCQLEVREREAWKQQHLKALLSPAQLGPSCYSVTVFCLGSSHSSFCVYSSQHGPADITDIPVLIVKTTHVCLVAVCSWACLSAHRE